MWFNDTNTQRRKRDPTGERNCRIAQDFIAIREGPARGDSPCSFMGWLRSLRQQFDRPARRASAIEYRGKTIDADSVL